jgi:hypothetical protein
MKNNKTNKLSTKKSYDLNKIVCENFSIEKPLN